WVDESATGSYTSRAEESHLVTDDRVRDWQRALWRDPATRAYLLEERGLDELTIKRFKLGLAHRPWTDPILGAITIPVYDEAGKLVNVRFYSRRVVGKRTIRSARGYGKARLYPVEVMDTNELCVVEGEFDALLLNSIGI